LFSRIWDLTLMKSIRAFKKQFSPIIKSVWATLGIPFDNTAIDEKIEGIIDVEALILISLLLMEQDRLTTDFPAWANRFSTLINHQKLKTMLKMIPGPQREIILENMKQPTFQGVSKSVRQIFLLEPPSETVIRTVRNRAQKLNTIENVAQTSIMLRNRLQYGTGFRADIISLTEIKDFNMRGTQLAKLLCTNDSTVSRILNDLKASGFLDRDNVRMDPSETYPGMFISSQTIWNICEIIDAYQFTYKELKQTALESLNFKHDGCGKKYLHGLDALI
jgi:hypothetical protein